jgi:hypothetical protein
MLKFMFVIDLVNAPGGSGPPVTSDTQSNKISISVAETKFCPPSLLTSIVTNPAELMYGNAHLTAVSITWLVLFFVALINQPFTIVLPYLHLISGLVPLNTINPVNVISRSIIDADDITYGGVALMLVPI